MMRIRFAGVVFSLVGVMAVSGVASANLNGTYNLAVETTMTPPNCRWVGHVSMTQDGVNLSGETVLGLDLSANPDPFCVAIFPALSGTLTGTLIGTAIDLTGTLPPYSAQFVGTTNDRGLTATGTWTGNVNTWRARGVFAASRVPTAAPVLGGPGLVIFVLGLLAAGIVSLWGTRHRACVAWGRTSRSI